MRFRQCWWLAVAGALLVASGVEAQVNSWTNSLNGNTHKWEVGANWSLGSTAFNQSIFITNGIGPTPRNRTVNIDATTAGVTSAMTVSNLTVGTSGTGLGNSTLFLNNAGSTTPFLVRNSLTITTGAFGAGFLSITNSILHMGDPIGFDGPLNGIFTVDSTVTFNSGTITTISGCGLFCVYGPTTVIGNTKTGVFTMAGGLWQSGPVQVGSSPSTYGTLTIAGGSASMATLLSVPLNIVHGTVWITGGDLTMSYGKIGSSSGAGQLTVSNGTWSTTGEADIGIDGGTGTLTFEGGTNTAFDLFLGVNTTTSQGTVWMNNGFLTASRLEVGKEGVGRMTVSNGTVTADQAYIGLFAGSAGTLTMVGGTFNVAEAMFVSPVDCSVTGVVTMTGGNLNITNNAGTAYLELDSGTFSLSGGTLRADKIVATNTCAHFLYTAGTLISTNVILNPNDDSDGDGILNGYEQSHGLDPLNPADSATDKDGDGQSNLAEFLAGTDATNSLSSLRITSITPVSTNLVVTWTTATGKTNALQRTAGVAGSFATNGFATIFTATNTVAGTTNYLDVGAATNVPAFYYRVRLVP